MLCLYKYTSTRHGNFFRFVLHDATDDLHELLFAELVAAVHAVHEWVSDADGFV